MSKKAIGLNEFGIKFGFYGADGAKPATCTESLGTVFKDTAVLEQAEGEQIFCECEEFEDPEEISIIQGKTTLKFSTSDFDAATCKKIYGGEITEGKWKSPKIYAPKIVCLEFTTKSGIKVEIERAMLITRMNWAIKKNGYGLLEHTITKLGTPASTDGGLSITDPVVQGSNE